MTRCRSCQPNHPCGAHLSEEVIAPAHLRGGDAAHFRPARTEKGWRTPVSADGAGFPDLVLVRDRIVFAELKSEKRHMSEEQLAWASRITKAGGETYCWRPSD